MRMRLRDSRLLAQALVVGSVLALIYGIAAVTEANLRARGIATGFDFLGQPARFNISETLISFAPGRDSYARALLAGAANTLFVSLLVIALATVAGVAVGLAKLSHHWLLSRTAGVYVEVIRNVPLPLQLLLCYQLFLSLPGPRQAIDLGGVVVLSNRGLWLPSIRWEGIWPALEFPVLRGFNFQGGTSLSPELAALVIALTVYSIAFIAEIVRAGIRSVPAGQWEAGEALGLPRREILRRVVAPLSLRFILPPLANEYMNIIKNSSLAVVIGYPELTSLVNTMLSDTGRPIESIAILMLAYLTLSLPVGFFMNWYNRRAQVSMR